MLMTIVNGVSNWQLIGITSLLLVAMLGGPLIQLWDAKSKE